MKGSLRDTRWARAIRKRMLDELEQRTRELKLASLEEKAARLKTWLERVRDAKWFIRNRYMGTRTLIRTVHV